MSASTVLILDPGNYTPYYDVNLSSMLVQRGWHVEWLTSPYLFESIRPPDGLSVRYPFLGLFENSLVQRLPKIRRMPGVRRVIKAISYPFDLLRLDRELASRSPTLLHVQWALLPYLDAFYWRRWQKKGWRIVYTAHDVTGLAGTTPQILREANRHLFRIADAVITHSQVEREQIIRMGVSPSRVRQIPQGGPGVFVSPQPKTSEARAALGIPLDRPTIFFFGLLKPYKGLNILLQSLAVVREQVPQVLLMIAGEALMARREHNRLIAELDLASHVYWKPFYIPSAQVGTFFAAADVVAIPYLSASSSAVLLSAYSYARPVVATTVGGLPEMVEPNQTGILVPPSDANALARALVQLLRDPSQSRAMGERARQYVVKYHSWSLIAELTGELYRSTHESSHRRI